ncbi:response regulator [Paraburkholderia sp. CNPSo 3157]|uniref:Response regulator n=1 Tax=Paraburkholderia franconis TaxID=2654983 RepID=A0A7X1NBL9_9BURK|nr:response regulator [Paraburkholderia franconis]MPW18978.1 response regulator [Paraburkholderia franconis]
MCRVLLVDDDANTRDALGAVLQNAGHVVTLARDGPEALRLAVMVNPQVIVCDVMMPAMDGPEVACRIRTIPVLANVPVVLMSAVLPVPAVPVAAMLRKPFDPSLLLRLVDDLTDQSASGRSA